MGLGKPGRLRVDQPAITGELGPAPDAYTHFSPVMIAALSKTAGRSAFDEGGRQGRPKDCSTLSSDPHDGRCYGAAARILHSIVADVSRWSAPCRS